MGPGGPPGLQNRVSGGCAVRGGFDSHALPPRGELELRTRDPRRRLEHPRGRRRRASTRARRAVDGRVRRRSERSDGAATSSSSSSACSEDDPTYNAGRGSHLNSAGALEMDASIMEGTTRRAGAVAAVVGVAPSGVRSARMVMEESPHVLLVGNGAKRFAKRAGAEMCYDPIAPRRTRAARWKRSPRGRARPRGEGVLRTRAGRTGPSARSRSTGAGGSAAATSTGGTQDKAPGRVGDSAIVGAAPTPTTAAARASCTGWGEPILRAGAGEDGGRRVGAVDAHPSAASRAALRELARLSGFGGVILVDRRGASRRRSTRRAWRADSRMPEGSPCWSSAGSGAR